MALKAFGSTEVLATIEELVGTKSLSRESLITGIEMAISDVVTSKYPNSGVFVSKMNRKTGEIDVYREMHIVENVEDELQQISLDQAKVINADLKIGDKVHEPMPDIYRNRNTSNVIADLILKNIQTLEKAIEFVEFSKRKGEVVSGFIKKETPLYSIIAIGHKTEAILPKKGMIPGEVLKVGDRINAYIEEVERSDTKFQIVLSRSSDHFLGELLKDNIPEIEDGLIEIKSIARDPGSKAKVTVWSSDYKLDPVGACIGPRGSRIKPVVDELKGEKIDIILWNRDLEALSRSVLATGKISKISKINIAQSTEGGKYKIEAIVPNESLSVTIGRRGQNVKLASKILDCDIKIVSEEEKQMERMQKFKKATAELEEALSIEETIAQLLFSEGMFAVKDIADADVSRIANIEGFDIDIANELKKRAINHINQRDKECEDMMSATNFDKRIAELPHFNVKDMLVLGENKITTLQQIADLAYDELTEIFGKDNHLTNDEASEIVLKARKTVYNI